MQQLCPLRELPDSQTYNEGDNLVIFGEVFQRGYVNGLIDEAQKKGMKIIYSTVGRRDEEGQLKPLSATEIKDKGQSPLINIPLESGFDMQPSQSGITPCDQLQGIKLKSWTEAALDFNAIESSRNLGHESFKTRLADYVEELKKELNPGKNTLFVHTMAGGVPRAKIVMPLMNRVFKGFDDRYLSSEIFWNSDIGKLCNMSFEAVTAQTLQDLLDATESIRSDHEQAQTKCRYVAFGYHGTELFINKEYRWQSYSPYLQGFAKKSLEKIAVKAQAAGIKASVFNAPEILTNSSSIFLGIEVALYPLLAALLNEDEDNEKVNALLLQTQGLLKDEYEIHDILTATENYFTSRTILNDWTHYDQWPQHNGPEQMKLMRETSQAILNMHISDKSLMTSQLSEVVFQACGYAMVNASFNDNTDPVLWIGHDLVAKHFIMNQGQ